MSIDPDWDDGPKRSGDVVISWPLSRFTEKSLKLAKIQVALAGPVAEMIHREEEFHPATVLEWSSDWSQAWGAASELFPDSKLRLKYLEQQSVEIYHSFSRDEHWQCIAALVDELEAHETLEWNEIREVLRPS